MPDCLVSLRQVGHFFDSRLVFKCVDLDIFPGQIVLLCGPNGAGKSTLLRLMAGFLKPTGGEVRRGVDRGATALMGHECAVYPSLTARENLVFWARLYRLRGADIDGLLASVGLGDFAAEKAGIFSRGMAQRLNLARILLLDPRLLLLDEPTTGLDVHSRSFFYACLQNWKKQEKAVVWVSHDLEQDKKLADCCYTLRAGQLVSGSDAWQEREC